jgi:thiol-disulfide isomerase/thioredoxin
MDRLPTLIGVGACALLLGCEREGDGPAVATGTERVAAVSASADSRTLEDLCDVMPAPESAPALVYPALSDDSAAPPDAGWRWINLWATWCVPCVEEIPMLRAWEETLASQATPLEIVFLSVDESADVIDAYRRDHPDAPGDYRVADPDDVPSWIAELGLDGGATIPIHIVVDAENRVRCLRSGKVQPRDLPLVERLLAGSD